MDSKRTFWKWTLEEKAVKFCGRDIPAVLISAEKEMNKKFIENLKIHDARARCSQNEMKMKGECFENTKFSERKRGSRNLNSIFPHSNYKKIEMATLWWRRNAIICTNKKREWTARTKRNAHSVQEVFMRHAIRIPMVFLCVSVSTHSRKNSYLLCFTFLRVHNN